jgi:DNA helicase IV
VTNELVDPANILVVTGHTSIRDQIRNEAPGGFVCDRWEERFDGNIVCETIHRIKGLERDAVILVTSQADLPDNLLYVGMSRAISKLMIVGPPALRGRLGLDKGED